ncbi:hypothetical protein Pint_25817 [Pistacia integerrima]|uniref:Uncharacterized protein n=1 Tax=Pistacia integerrima TaxID=434235 RepID=A0ACC0YER8_9ROSI|nr:hypothetical protein Pint_25817 [Pistacia integerrima]
MAKVHFATSRRASSLLNSQTLLSGPFLPQVILRAKDPILSSNTVWDLRNLSHGIESEERKAEARAGIMKDRHRLTVKGKKKKQRFANADERLKYKLEKAKVKQALLIERLKQYEAPKVQGSMDKPHDLTGEECFYFTKMAQKDLTMCQLAEEHWKKHETVEVICKLQAL